MGFSQTSSFTAAFRGDGVRIFQTRRFPNELSLQAPHSGVFFVACSRRESRRKKLNGEAAYEIRLGEWQDTRPQSFCALCCEPIGESYLRELATRLPYCDHKCCAGHCQVPVLALQKHARAL
jgi:hypothetical protein